MIMRGPAVKKTCARIRITRVVIAIRNLRKCIYLLARISCVGGQGTVPFATHNYYYYSYYSYYHCYYYY